MDYREQLLKSVKRHLIFGEKKRDYIDKDVLHVGYGIDDAYARCMGVSIASICENNKEENIVFHVVASKLNAENVKKIQKLAEVYFVIINIYSIDEKAFNNLPTQVHFPSSIYYRYILPSILDVPRVLYLDADIICLDALRPVWTLDLGSNVIGAVQDVEWMERKRNKVLNLKNHRYFNSGVLLMDIKKWNKINIIDKVIQVLSNNPKNFRYPDQDALNLILSGHVHYLEMKWNHLNIVPERQQESVLLHFAAHPKPWTIAWPISKVCNSFNYELYFRYEQLTPWKNYPLMLPDNYKEMKNYAKCLLKQGAYLQGGKWYLRYITSKFTTK